MPDTEQEYKKFLPLAGIFPFTQMFFDLHQIRLMGIRISTGFHFIKKRHLSLYFKGRRLFGFCSIVSAKYSCGFS